ncbi:hypothetical protein BC937DRAFT_87302 [Endogone sp. FLAS-F59071]|nr:hypothetical protein BC937DRAFT_87302 [Endogone sp. FLAS-F59071]|eukprot:RUS19549.1 hypothetical protein BC937DRAFT_87302 [Endogone sp. FLAS-F59071]
MSDSKLHLFALVIGTGTNLEGDISPSFKSCINDAEWLAELLQDPSVCGYPKENVKVLLGENATRVNIIEKLDEIKEKVLELEDDEVKKCTVVFFFSGHGAKEGEKTYLIPYGCNTPSKNDAISGDMLFEKFKAMDSGRVLLLLNACYSGAVMPRLGDDDQETSKAATPFTKIQVNKLLSGKGFAYLSASQPSQASLTGYLSKQTKKRYSPFTIGLARGFAGLSKKNYYDNLVYIADLQTNCVAYVSRKTKGKQIPHFDYKGDNFAVGYFKPGASDRYPLLGEDVEFDIEPEDVQNPETTPNFVQTTKNIGTARNIRLNNVTIGGNYISGVGSYTK